VTAPPPVAAAPAPGSGPASNPARWGRHLAIRIPTLAVGGLLALLLLGIGSYAVANVLVRTTERDDTTFTGAVRRVEVHVTGSVHVRGGPADEARLARRSTFGVHRPEVRQELVDGLLTVRVECPGGVSVVCDNRIDLVVPADAALELHGLGTHVTDMTGDVEVRSGAGEVELVRVSGRIDASVGGGAVNGRDLRTTEVRATSGAGSVDLQFTVAPTDVDAESGAGSVLVTIPDGPEAYRVDADAGAGEDVVRVRTDPTSERVIRANAGAGSVEVLYG
jgi:hypothetical protein